MEEDKIGIGECQLDTLNWVKTIKSTRATPSDFVTTTANH